jgi:hypothetical protein
MFDVVKVYPCCGEGCMPEKALNSFDICGTGGEQERGRCVP